MKKLLSRILYVLAIILSYLMCIIVTYRYCSRMCNMDGTPAKFPWILLILFLLAIWVCIFFGIKFGRDNKKEEKPQNGNTATEEKTETTDAWK